MGLGNKRFSHLRSCSLNDLLHHATKKYTIIPMQATKASDARLLMNERIGYINIAIKDALIVIFIRPSQSIRSPVYFFA